MEAFCPLCKLRVTNEEVEREEVQIKDCFVVHDTCLADYKLRRGVDWSRWEVVRELTGGI